MFSRHLPPLNLVPWFGTVLGQMLLKQIKICIKKLKLGKKTAGYMEEEEVSKEKTSQPRSANKIAESDFVLMAQGSLGT